MRSDTCRSLAAATSFMERFICWVVLTDSIRVRVSRREAILVGRVAGADPTGRPYKR